MRFLGIDYGTKRVGLAVSDENHRLAFPKDVFKNNGELFKKIEGVIKADRVAAIVVGESLDFAGLPNALLKEIGYFVSRLEKKFKLPVYLEKEFWTTVEARRSAPESTSADASAAALILQRFLDRYNQQNTI